MNTPANPGTELACYGSECAEFDVTDDEAAQAACLGLARLITECRTDYGLLLPRECPWAKLKRDPSIIDEIAPVSAYDKEIN